MVHELFGDEQNRAIGDFKEALYSVLKIIFYIYE